MKNTNCILAEQGLHLHNSGRCNSCSDSSQWWKDSNGIDMDLTTHSIEKIWNSKSRQDFLYDLRNGVEHPNCIKCWQKERVGIKSKRQISNEIFKHNNKSTPQFIDLKWGNVCNLNCRHCNPWTSSKWLKEWYEADTTRNQSYIEYLNEFKSTQKSYHHNNTENFHKNFFKWFSNSEHLMLYGGEGMYVKDVQKMFEYAINSGTATDIDIYINTNGTIYSERWIEIFKQFRSVKLAFSIDGIGQSFNYIRHGAEWNNVVENYKKYTAIKNIQTQIVTTVFTLNVYDIVDIVYTIYKELDSVPAVNFVYGPEWWDIRILPDNIKQHIHNRNINKLDKIKQSLTDTEYQKIYEQIDQVQRFLLDTVKDSENKYQKMMHWIKSIDKNRNENFQNVFYEYNQLLKVYN
jgi:MoaA/NifB/PqqE/SkfB family radical SAM enzyme